MPNYPSRTYDQREEELDVTGDGNELTIRGELEVFKARGISISGEPLVSLLEDYDKTPVEITVKKYERNSQSD